MPYLLSMVFSHVPRGLGDTSSTSRGRQGGYGIHLEDLRGGSTRYGSSADVYLRPSTPLQYVYRWSATVDELV